MLSNATTIGPQIQTNADAMFDAVFPHSLGFRITMPYEDACGFIRRIDRYNEFEAGCVLDALDHIDRLIPRRYYNEGNPNNGQRRYEITVGREGSPVLYLDMFEFSWNGQEPLSDHTIDLIKKEMELTGRADEADCDCHDTGSGRRLSFRFWWD